MLQDFGDQSHFIGVRNSVRLAGCIKIAIRFRRVKPDAPHGNVEIDRRRRTSRHGVAADQDS